MHLQQNELEIYIFAMFKFVFMQFFGRVEACESSSMSLRFRLVYGILIFTQGVQLLHPRIKNRQQNVAEKIFFSIRFGKSSRSSKEQSFTKNGPNLSPISSRIVL